MKEKYEKICNLYSELENEFTPIAKEVKKLRGIMDFEPQTELKYPLKELIQRLTKTSRRTNLNHKVIFKVSNNYSKDYIKIGLNHQGIGYEDTYGYQLNPLTNYVNKSDLQHLRSILFDEQAIIEITTKIKKSNQELFLRVIQILKKHNLEDDFDIFKKDILGEFELKLKGFKIKINSRYGDEIKFMISPLKDIENKSDFEYTLRLNPNGEINPSINFNGADYLSGFSKFTSRRENLADLKTAYILLENKGEIIKHIKKLQDIAKDKVTKYSLEHEELIKLALPLLALEKL